MNVEILSKKKNPLYDNHGCSWGDEYKVKFKINDKLFIAEYTESGLDSDEYYVSIYESSKNRFFFDKITDVKFLTPPPSMTTTVFANTLAKLLEQDKNFQKYLPEEDKLKKIAEKVFNMDSDY